MQLSRRNGGGDGRGSYAAVGSEEMAIEHHDGHEEELVDLIEVDEEEDGELEDHRYAIAEEGDPFEARKKSMAAGACLLLIGCICLTLGILIVTGAMETSHSDRGWPLVVVGIMTFLPGSWATFISVMAYFRVSGYRIEELPVYE